jgi:hypothetical protein
MLLAADSKYTVMAVWGVFQGQFDIAASKGCGRVEVRLFLNGFIKGQNSWKAFDFKLY